MGIYESNRASVMDAERSGKPSSSTPDEEEKEHGAVIVADRRITKKNITSLTAISQGSAFYLASGSLELHRFSDNPAF